jgi:hypothetical protein
MARGVPLHARLFHAHLLQPLPSHKHVVPPHLCLGWLWARTWLWVCLVLSQVCAMGEYGFTSKNHLLIKFPHLCLHPIILPPNGKLTPL